ncbi:MAG: macro domain-containing protein [Aristaeellaceae bacterium]
MPFRLIRADLTQLRVDAIVNAANNRLQQGGGVCGAIFHAAGEAQLQSACNRIGHCETGRAVITPGFALPARYVIHTVGPVWQGGHAHEEALLRSCYLSALTLAAQHRLRSVAFPLISAGIYGYPRQEAIRVAVEAIGAFLTRDDTPDMDVTLALFDRCSYREGSTLYGRIASYLDENSPTFQRYRTEARTRRREEEAPWSIPPQDGAPMEQDASSMDFWQDAFGSLPPSDVAPDAPETAPQPDGVWMNEASAPQDFWPEAASPMSAAPGEDLAQQLKRWAGDRFRREETFSQCLLRLIDASGEKDSTIYKRANVDRRLFSKIRSNPHYQPGKPTVLAFCLALHLSREDADMLLRKAGYALTRSSRLDLAMEYCLRNGVYDVHQINVALFELDLPILGE